MAEVLRIAVAVEDGVMRVAVGQVHHGQRVARADRNSDERKPCRGVRGPGWLKNHALREQQRKKRDEYVNTEPDEDEAKQARYSRRSQNGPPSPMSARSVSVSSRVWRRQS